MILEVREALTSLEVNGEITARAVLEAARDDKNPLHSFFEWDNDAASEQYRLDQARGLIRHYRIEFIGVDQINKSVRGYVSIRKPLAEGGERIYLRTEAVLTSTIMREQLLADLKRDLSMMRAKYGCLAEYSAILLEQVAAVERRAS